MNRNLFIALVGALLNAMLTVLIPCFMGKTDQEFLKNVKAVYRANKDLVLTSSLIIAITIYLALEYHTDVAVAINDLSEMTLKQKLLNLNNLSAALPKDL
jgi:hypothetical protein